MNEENQNEENQNEESNPTEPTNEQGGENKGETTTPNAKPVEYDFAGSVPDGFALDEEQSKAFGAMSTKLGLSAEQAQELAGYGMNYAKGMMEAIEAKQEAQSEEWAKQTKETLGGDYEKTVGLVGVAVEKLTQKIPNLREVLNTNGLGNRVEVVQMLAEFGRVFGEDKGQGQGGGTPSGGGASFYPNTDFSKYK